MRTKYLQNIELYTGSLGLFSIVAGTLSRDSPDFGLVCDAIGAVIFVVSMAIYIVKSHERFEKIQIALESQSSQLKGIQVGNNLDKAYTTVTPVINELKTMIRQPEAKCDPILIACEYTLSSIVNRYTQNLASVIKAGYNSKDRRIQIDDVAPVCIFLESFAKNLPSGSVYIGVTFLTSAQAWDGNDVYNEWGKVLKRRSKNKEIQVCRLWCLGGALLTDALRNEIEAQRQDGIVVRVLTESMAASPQLSDISLVWTGNRENAINFDEFGYDSVRTLEENFYEPLSGLKFEVYTSSYLKSVAILDKNEIAQRTRQFSESWRKGKALVEEPFGMK